MASLRHVSSHGMDNFPCQVERPIRISPPYPGTLQHRQLTISDEDKLDSGLNACRKNVKGSCMQILAGLGFTLCFKVVKLN